MYRELEAGFYWIQEIDPTREDIVAQLADDQDWYVPGEDLHVPQNGFLLCGEETLLFDTTSPAHTDTVLADLDDILDDRGLDYLVVSHPDIPHAGNASAILRQYPGATLVAPSFGSLHELYHLGDARKVDVGESIDLGGRVVTFTEAPILDAAMTHWMIDETTGMLFTVDWMCFPHMGSEVLTCVDEIESDVTVKRMVEFNARVIFWLQYVDSGLVVEELERFVDAYDITGVAPTHGLVVRENVDEYLEKYHDVVYHVAEHGREQTI
ncbi:MAG: MBL fold metallo-hydrolase [Halobacteriota archaeon]